MACCLCHYLNQWWIVVHLRTSLNLDLNEKKNNLVSRKIMRKRRLQICSHFVSVSLCWSVFLWWEPGESATHGKRQVLIVWSSTTSCRLVGIVYINHRNFILYTPELWDGDLETEIPSFTTLECCQPHHVLPVLVSAVLYRHSPWHRWLRLYKRWVPGTTPLLNSLRLLGSCTILVVPRVSFLRGKTCVAMVKLLPHLTSCGKN